MNQLQRTEARYKELLMEVDYKLAETRSRPPEMIPTSKLELKKTKKP